MRSGNRKSKIQNRKSKKHRCKGCEMCQWCSDSRCDVCRCTGSKFSGMSFEEQIAIYDRINRNS